MGLLLSFFVLMKLFVYEANSFMCCIVMGFIIVNCY